MIVSGEASESEDEITPTPSTSSKFNHVPLRSRSSTSLKGVSPSPSFSSTTSSSRDARDVRDARSAGLSHSWNLTMSSVSKAVGKLGESLSRQATLDDPPYSNYSGKSLLHQKLHEKNDSLKKNIDGFVEDTISRVPKELENILGSYAKTQFYFQEVVISMQQANHYTAESLESMEDCIEISQSIRFPET
ncbi:hypothetical protein TCAL_07607 [Tigriopus californicus]|uniref:Uncharacterized protein n=1 Tax=Tigriopus californicus TaxID=6832 RepID=A0A553PGF2_TIGCA|nr:hypothetical protein TCAL_07607 [Tigriopus californicus]|eukprot:TCALIF_07607-PA protein Name:"Protein of unknown function" AED:0.69 eAED:0.71 QI:0/-1/0/1/-1/1/1/0/189